MSEEKLKILKMIEDGTITAEQGMQLMKELGEGETVSGSSSTGGTLKVADPKFLIVKVEPKKEGGDKVLVKVPFKLIRAGMKLGSLLPAEAQEKIDDKFEAKGMNFRVKDFQGKEMDEMIEALKELNVDVDGTDEQVSVFFE